MTRSRIARRRSGDEQDALGRDMVCAQPAFDEIAPVGIFVRVFHRLDAVGEGESLADGVIGAGRNQPDGRL